MDNATRLSRPHTLMLRLALGCRDAGHRVAARLDRERGAVMTEYGLLLMCALIAAFAILALFGKTVLGLFQRAYDDFTGAYDPEAAGTT